MRIGITCYPTFGGSGIVATELGKGLAALGHEVHFITYSMPARLNYFAERLYYHEVEVIQYPLFEYSPYALSLAAKMAEVIEYQRLDLLHVHYAVPHSNSAFLAKQIVKNRKIKIITTLHGTDISLVGNHPSLLPITKHGIEMSDGVTAVSKFLRDQTYNELNVEKEIEVIYNFIDPDIFKPVNTRTIKRCFAPNGEKIISNISNFRPIKRLDIVIKVFNEIRRKIPSKLILVGDGPERAKIEKICRDLKICQHIKFLGKQDSIVEILSASDLFLLPSESESFGLAALEALACEVPVIASNIGGLPEVFNDGEEGFLVDINDTDKMVKMSLKILEDLSLQTKMSKKARKRAITHYNLKKILKTYETYYKRVLSQ